MDGEGEEDADPWLANAIRLDEDHDARGSMAALDAVNGAPMQNLFRDSMIALGETAEPQAPKCNLLSFDEGQSMYCAKSDCRIKERKNPGSGCSGTNGACDMKTGRCRCREHYGNCDCSINCKSYSSGCKECMLDV